MICYPTSTTGGQTQFNQWLLCYLSFRCKHSFFLRWHSLETNSFCLGPMWNHKGLTQVFCHLEDNNIISCTASNLVQYLNLSPANEEEQPMTSHIFYLHLYAISNASGPRWWFLALLVNLTSHIFPPSSSRWDTSTRALRVPFTSWCPAINTLRHQLYQL